MVTITAKLDRSGRVLIPAGIRRKLNLRAGDEIILRVDETGIKLCTRDQALARISHRLHEVIPADRLLSEELIQERRADAERENRR